MKFVQFKYQNKNSLGIVTPKGIINLSNKNNLYPSNLKELFSFPLEKLKELIRVENELILEEDISYLPAVLNPGKIFCVGFNYLDHRKEVDFSIPDYPIIFSKLNNAIASHLEVIKIPTVATKLDYEAELVVIIGKAANSVSKEEALDYVFGYTCGNDITDRALQFKTSQWLIGKSLTKSAPIGPYIISKDEIDPNYLTITCRLNGEIVQQANTSDMIFDVATIVSYISHYIELLPGDIIFTGTPAGAIMGRKEQVWLKRKDVVEVSISQIGTLKNSFN